MYPGKYQPCGNANISGGIYGSNSTTNEIYQLRKQITELIEENKKLHKDNKDNKKLVKQMVNLLSNNI